MYNLLKTEEQTARLALGEFAGRFEASAALVDVYRALGGALPAGDGAVGADDRLGGRGVGERRRSDREGQRCGAPHLAQGAVNDESLTLSAGDPGASPLLSRSARRPSVHSFTPSASDPIRISVIPDARRAAVNA